jgi:threonine aldolase
MTRIVDLRSDTLTRPSPAMRAAIANADVGDEQKREDPTVIALEARVAAMLGHDAAVFVPSATMANQIALRTLGAPGDEVLADRRSHVFLYELGAPAVLSGLVMKPIVASEGTFDAAALEATFVAQAWYRSGSTVLCVENTHAETGGQVWDRKTLADVVERARSLGLRVHLDGARLLNAAVADGVPAHVISAQFDTVTLCLSKGLGCPVGALLAGSADLIEQARRSKQLLGGSMRQAGILAAAGLFALDNNVDRLSVDHEHARLLGGLLTNAGVRVGQGSVDSNIVLIEARAGAAETAGRLESAGIRLATVDDPRLLRAVTHLDISEDDIHYAAEVISRVCGDAAKEG